MRIFVTGGAGYVGSSIVKELAAAGHEITVLSRALTHSALQDHPGVRMVQGDLEDPRAVEAIAGHEAVVHNALLWDEEPTELELKDLRASVRVFEAAIKFGVPRIVYTSSTAVHRPFLPLMNDQTALRTSDLYGAIKASTELFLFAMARQANVKANVIRVGPVVGPPAIEGSPIKSDRMLAAFARAAIAGENIRVKRGSGRQFVSNSDVGKMFRALLESDSANEVFLCVDQEVTTWESLAEALVVAADSPSKLIVDGDAQPGDAFRFDTDKLVRTLGLRFDSRAAMRRHIELLLESCRSPS
jgi:nucleoside-diphosphate-sugar epimerase